MELEGKPVVVVGLARSGIAAAGFLASRGARVVATDRKPARELPAEVAEPAPTGRAPGAGRPLARRRSPRPTLVVVSPGVPWDLPELAAARAAGVPVMAELELGFRFLPRAAWRR